MAVFILAHILNPSNDHYTDCMITFGTVLYKPELGDKTSYCGLHKFYHLSKLHL